MLVVLHVPLHGLEGVDDGGVVPAGELAADLLHAHAGDFTQDVDGDAAGGGDVGVPLGAPDVGRGHVEGAGHLAHDLLDGHGHRLGLGQDVLDGILRHADDGLDALQHVVGVELFHCAFQLADVIFQMVGDELGHVLGQIEVEKLCLALDDGHAGLEIRRLDVGGQALQGAERGASGATFGAYDWLNRTLGGNYAERKQRLQEAADSAGIGLLNELTGAGLELAGNVAGGGGLLGKGLIKTGLRGSKLAAVGGGIDGMLNAGFATENLADLPQNLLIGGISGA